MAFLTHFSQIVALKSYLQQKNKNKILKAIFHINMLEGERLYTWISHNSIKSIVFISPLSVSSSSL